MIRVRFSMKNVKFICIFFQIFLLFALLEVACNASEESYIKWVDFKVTAEALTDTSDLDIRTRKGEKHIDWISSLSYLGQKYGGDFSKYDKKDLAELEKSLKDKEVVELCKNEKLYKYYKKAYGAILSGMLGEYRIENENGTPSDQYHKIYYNTQLQSVLKEEKLGKFRNVAS
jgi:hypothetical protein